MIVRQRRGWLQPCFRAEILTEHTCGSLAALRSLCWTSALLRRRTEAESKTHATSSCLRVYAYSLTFAHSAMVDIGSTTLPSDSTSESATSTRRTRTWQQCCSQ